MPFHGGEKVEVGSTMSLRVQLPEKFDFRKGEWAKWSRRFERFRHASGLVKDDETSQINTLIYAKGDQVDDILTSFNLTEEERKKYDTVIKKFDEHFVIRRKVIFELAKFNQRKQEDGETVDSFITALHALAEHCNYGTLLDDMIWDRTAVGLKDGKVSEKLQLDPDLTLAKAIHAASQNEAVKKQALMRSDFKESTETSEEVDAVRTKNSQKNRKHSTSAGQKMQKKQAPPSTTIKCDCCGKSPSHPKQSCPARDSVCRKCSKKGHREAACRTKVVAEVEKQHVFLTEVGSEITGGFWCITLSVNNSPITFKIDTGAEVTVIPEETYKSLKPTPKLKESNKILHGPAKMALPVSRCFEARIQRGDNATNQEIFVVAGTHQALLGLPAIVSLGIVKKIDSVNKDYKSQFPKLFTGLGRLDGSDYVVKLKEDAKPHAITTPRRVPLPLLSHVKEELNWMKKIHIISEVDVLAW